MNIYYTTEYILYYIQRPELTHRSQGLTGNAGRCSLMRSSHAQTLKQKLKKWMRYGTSQGSIFSRLVISNSHGQDILIQVAGPRTCNTGTHLMEEC